MRTPANGLLTCPRAWSCHRLHHLELLAPLGDVLGRELGEIVVVELPGRVVAPALRRLHRGARPRRASPARAAPARGSAPGTRTSNGRPAELPSGKSLNRKRGTPQCSTMSLAQPMITVGIPFASRCRAHQTHGLVTDRSAGDEDGHLGAVLAAALQQLGRVGLDRHPLAAVGRRAVKARRQRADPPGLHRLLQRGEGKPGVADRRPWCARGRSRRGRCGDRASSRSSRSRPCRTWRRRCTSRRAPGRPTPGWNGAAVVIRATRHWASGLAQRRERHVGEVGPAIGREADGLVVVARALHVGNRHVVLGGNRHRCLPWSMRQCPTSPAAASRASDHTERGCPDARRARG